jgi:hypothetical protein
MVKKLSFILCRMVAHRRDISFFGCFLFFFSFTNNQAICQSDYSHGLLIGFREKNPGLFQGNSAIEFLKDSVKIDSIEYFLPTHGVGDALFYRGSLIAANNGYILDHAPTALGVGSDFPSVQDTMGEYKKLHGTFRPQAGFLLAPDSTVQFSIPDVGTHIWFNQLTKYHPIFKLYSEKVCQGFVYADLSGWTGNLEYDNVGKLINDASNTSRMALAKSGYNSQVVYAVFYELDRRKFFIVKHLTLAEGLARIGVDSLVVNMAGCSQNGASLFSSDGSKYAYWTDCQIHIFDFDRCTGKLSNHRPVSVPERMIPGGGLAFSASGKYLYATEYTKLYRLDLSQPSLKLDTLITGSFNTATHPSAIGLSLGYMYTAPDSNIYITPPHRARYMHVINCPDAENPAEICFEKEGLSLPVYNMSTIPSNYNPHIPLLLGVNATCDSILLSDTKIQTDLGKLSLSPNPASTTVHVESPDIEFDGIGLFNINGVAILYHGFTTAGMSQVIDLTNLPDGIYSLVIFRHGSPAAAQKLVKHSN